NSFIPGNQEKQITNSPLLKLSEFKEEYINYAKLRFSKSYVERSIEPAFKFLIEYAGDIPLKQLDIKTIDNFIIAKYNKSTSAAAHYYRTLTSEFSNAVVLNYLEEKPI